MRGPWEVGGGDCLSAYSGTCSQDSPPAPMGLPQAWAGPGTWMQLQAAKR